MPSDEGVIRSQIEAAEETVKFQEDAFRGLREQDELDTRAAGGVDTVADITSPTIDQPDISIHEGIDEELHNDEPGLPTDEHGEGAHGDAGAPFPEETGIFDIGDPMDINDDGGEDAVIY